jgi:hypothetical protein
MTTVQTWIQEDFKTPNQQIYRKAGDFLSLDNLIPSVDGKRLERLPTWTGHVDFVTDFDTPYGAFYDESDERFGFMGSSTELEPGVGTFVGTMLIAHSDFATTYGIYTMGTNMGEKIGGNHKQNLWNIMGRFWFIDENGDVFDAADPYASSVTIRYNASNYSNDQAIAILPIRDTIFMVTDADLVYYHDPDAADQNDTFVLYYDTVTTLNVRNVVHFREDIVLFAGHDDGSTMIYQIPDSEPADLRQLIRLPAETAQYLPGSGQWGNPFCIHQDRLYFSPGIYWSDASNAEIAPIWIYDGNSVELVENVEAPIVPTAWGLEEWRGRLLLYFLKSGNQHVYLLHGDRFVQINDDTYTLPAHADLYVLGGEVWMPTMEGETEGWTRLDDFATGTFTSSWLDFGHPASQKHLSRLACVVTGAVTNFNVKIEYRADNETTWTEAVEEDNSRHVDAGNLGKTFYLLQIRVTFTDSTGSETAAYLESLAATYSYGVR